MESPLAHAPWRRWVPPWAVRGGTTAEAAGDAPAARPVSIRRPHFPALDGLRGLATLFVVAIHLDVFPWARGMFVGLDMFFVLSGFLITWLLLEEYKRLGSIDLKRFYVRRFLRLYPALLAMLVLTTMGVIVFRPAHLVRELGRNLVVLFYSGNWYVVLHPRSNPLGLLAHTWSLSQEEQFYFVWPVTLLVLLSCRVRLERVAAGLAVLLLAEPVWRAVLLWSLHANWDRIYFGADTHADGLLAGCLIGVLASSHLRERVVGLRAILPWAGWAAVVLILWAATSFSMGQVLANPLGPSVLTAASSVLLISLIANPGNPLKMLFTLPPLRWVGRVSYGWYIWHYPIYFGITLSTSPLATCARIVLSFAAATASYYLLERRALRLKLRFEPRSQVSTPAAGSLQSIAQ